MCWCFCFVFFFSSRRRHTRCLSDWSSDVCSSDLSSSASAGDRSAGIRGGRCSRASADSTLLTPGYSSSPVRHSLLERSEEHTSELQSLRHLVCRLLLEKKKKHKQTCTPRIYRRCG